MAIFGVVCSGKSLSDCAFREMTGLQLPAYGYLLRNIQENFRKMKDSPLTLTLRHPL